MKINLRDTENIFTLGLFLGLIGLVAAVIMAYMSQLTAAPIRAAALQDTIRSLRQVLPAFDNEPVGDAMTFALEDGGSVTFYRAFENGKLVGVAGEGRSRGYGGDIKGLVGILPDGKVRSVLVTGHNETPGLGSVVCDRKESKTILTLFKQSERPADQLPPNRILDQFTGHAAGATPWKPSRDGGEFDSITGATISCRAVTKLTWTVARAFELHRAEMMAQPEKKK
jgi:electron transport complex protein RnfG